MVRLGLGLIWLLHFLPLAVLSRFGSGLGEVLYALARERRDVVLINLKFCFPQLSVGERCLLARKHFRAFGRSVLEHGVLWWGSKQRVQRLVKFEGLEHWRTIGDRPVILLAPHFVGLDMGGARLVSEYPLVSVYSKQKDSVFEAILYRGRTRFVPPELYSRQQGIRPVVRALRKGLPFYYLPDMDFGERDSLFAPFFGVPAATITGLPRIAQLAGALVVPCVTRQLAGGAGYVVRLYPAWPDYPSGDLEADVRRMNAFIEERVREMPEQYYWLHKRFKTRPAGEPNPYD